MTRMLVLLRAIYQSGPHQLGREIDLDLSLHVFLHLFSTFTQALRGPIVGVIVKLLKKGPEVRVKTLRFWLEETVEVFNTQELVHPTDRKRTPLFVHELRLNF